MISEAAHWLGVTGVFPCLWLTDLPVLNEPLANSLENRIRGIPELQLHHVVIIATWHVLGLNKQMKLYLGNEVISEYVDLLSVGCVFVCDETYTFLFTTS